MRTFFGVVMATAVATGMPALRAQDARPYDVASVKPHPRGDVAPWNIRPEPGGRLRVTNMSLATLVAMANGVQKYQVVDAPAWATRDGYDILVKAVDDRIVSIDRMRPMLAAVLADRFQLSWRHEMREMPVYALVRTGQDRLGPNLHEAVRDCTGRTPAGGAAPTPEARLAAAQRCGVSARGGAITLYGFPLASLATIVAPLVNRVVVDRTGLAGNWDLEVEYTPDVAGPPAPAIPPAASTDAPSLFTALQEQLGLKLEPSRAPVDVIVIENVARPADD